VPPAPALFSFSRLLGIAYRETLELRRDALRLAFALLGSLVLMFVLGHGLSFDVEGLRFGVLDRDRSPESRAYVENIAGSRYFRQRPPIADAAELERRMRSGELSLAIEIPAGFGRDLRLGRQPEVGAWIDGALPYRGETIRGYVSGMHRAYEQQLARETSGEYPAQAFDFAPRYRYNQDFKSVNTMVPAVIPLLLMLIPAILMALGVVREK
jgi:ribosome-dependent ATPase